MNRDLAIPEGLNVNNIRQSLVKERDPHQTKHRRCLTRKEVSHTIPKGLNVNNIRRSLVKERVPTKQNTGGVQRDKHEITFRKIRLKQFNPFRVGDFWVYSSVNRLYLLLFMFNPFRVYSFFDFSSVNSYSTILGF